MKDKQFEQKLAKDAIEGLTEISMLIITAFIISIPYMLFF